MKIIASTTYVQDGFDLIKSLFPSSILIKNPLVLSPLLLSAMKILKKIDVNNEIIPNVTSSFKIAL